MWSETLSQAFTAILVVCALVVAGLAAYQHFFSPAPPPHVENWQSIAADGHRVGPKDAPVDIVVFFDYQCPYCHEAMATLDTIRQRYSGRVAVSFRHLPLSIHPQAAPAARAAECAAEESRFEAYHNLLFAHRTRLGQVAWDSLAAVVGVKDLDAFQSCVANRRPETRIERDVGTAQRLGFRSIPTIIVNGRVLRGSPPTEMLDRLVRAALEESA